MIAVTLVHAWTEIFYLDVSVEADSGVVCALQAFECHWALLLIVHEEDENPTCKVQQHSYCSSFSDATVCPVWAQEKKQRITVLLIYHGNPPVLSLDFPSKHGKKKLKSSSDLF